MKSNNIKIQPVRNRVAEIYMKVTGSNLIGELMMAAGNGNSKDENYKFIAVDFECGRFDGNKMILVTILVKTEEEIETQNVTIQYEDNVQTLSYLINSAVNVDEELAQELTEVTGEDCSAYIGGYMVDYGGQYNFVDGETYTFYVNGVEVATETGISCEEEPTEDPIEDPNQSQSKE